MNPSSQERGPAAARSLLPIKSQWARRAPAFGAFVALMALGTLNLAVGSSGNGLGLLAAPAMALLLGVPGLLLVIYLVLRRRNLRLTLDERQLRYRDWRGRGWTIDLADLHRVHYLDITRPGASPRKQWAVLEGPPDQPPRLLWRQDWKPFDLQDLWQDLGLTRTGPEIASLPTHLHKRPSLPLPWHHRHPALAGLTWAALILAYTAAVLTPFLIATA
ncbi:hypothetical protein ACFWYW_56645 [Nonomuraea sp. NPDC059023]|uniref:hypothetical protein n=1 Tax=unclassified Nonomuraea TaxID=2593643 RepID=UPI0036A0A219